MITIEYAHSDKAFCLQVYGHARSAPKGEDLVCCAASTLIYTAAQSVLDLYGWGALKQFPETVLDPGNAQVAAIAAEGEQKLVEQMFRTVVTGYRLLERQYPEYVMFREMVNGEQA